MPLNQSNSFFSKKTRRFLNSLHNKENPLLKPLKLLEPIDVSKLQRLSESNYRKLNWNDNKVDKPNSIDSSEMPCSLSWKPGVNRKARQRLTSVTTENEAHLMHRYMSLTPFVFHVHPASKDSSCYETLKCRQNRLYAILGHDEVTFGSQDFVEMFTSKSALLYEAARTKHEKHRRKQEKFRATMLAQHISAAEANQLPDRLTLKFNHINKVQRTVSISCQPFSGLMPHPLTSSDLKTDEELACEAAEKWNHLFKTCHESVVCVPELPAEMHPLLKRLPSALPVILSSSESSEHNSIHDSIHDSSTVVSPSKSMRFYSLTDNMRKNSVISRLTKRFLSSKKL